MSFLFKIEKKLTTNAGEAGNVGIARVAGAGGSRTRARAGILTTPHGVIETPAFVTVGTKATIKALTPEEVSDLGAQVVLANTYHLYLEPGDEIVRDAGGIHTFMNWQGPTMTDSGGFQVFSLGAAYDNNASKISERGSMTSANADVSDATEKSVHESLATIDEDGVDFKSVIDGSSHRFTPERSMEIQHNIGADMIFAFDECTSPHAPYEYQQEAMERTHRWAKRSLDYHQTHVKRDANGSAQQALFGIVQGGRHEDLRRKSAEMIGAMDFDGFGIGGSFDKEDMYTVVGWVNSILPEEKPKHLLGIGEPADLFGGIENGVDLFDCVAPTRLARNGTLYGRHGRININNAQYVNDFGKIDGGIEDGTGDAADSKKPKPCACYTCTHYTPAYLSHLFRSKEMLGATLASIHNLYFVVNLVKKIRLSIIDGTFQEFKTAFLKSYYK